MEAQDTQAPLFPVSSYDDQPCENIPAPAARHSRNRGKMTRTQLLELANQELKQRLLKTESELKNATSPYVDPRQPGPAMDRQYEQPEAMRPTASVAKADELARLQKWADDSFVYHKPSWSQIDRYHNIRLAGKQLAKTIMHCCPVSAEQTTALQKIREVVMWANASIACNEKEY